MGAVVLPALLSIAVGVVALALSQQAVDIVVGVLVLCFAGAAVTGSFVVFGILRRHARLAQMQTDFVANVSHDLRTPVAGIRVLAEALARGRTGEPGKTEEVGALILNESARLQELVERILRWRQLAAGAAVIEVEAQPLAPVVGDALEPYLHSNARIRVDVAGQLPTVRIDRVATIDIIRNLVDNAVKFGGDNEVEVVVRGNGHEVVLEVRDQGPGIPRATRKRVFERFYRDPVHMRGKQGAGLGLSIVRELTRAQGGRVEVHSEPGIGTAFFVRLPAGEAEPEVE
jgi:signal transduction histidine kinase